MYAKIDLSNHTVLATIFELPDSFAGADVSDLAWAGMPGVGYWPVAYTSPEFDPTVEALTTEVGPLVVSIEDEAVSAAYGVRALTAEEIAARNPAPDNPTLGDWRVATLLWGRLSEVLSRIEALIASGHPLGEVAKERVEYSNNVLRAQLLQLKDALGFTAEDVDESLWRADRVAQGDLSGVWPLPAAG